MFTALLKNRSRLIYCEVCTCAVIRLVEAISVVLGIDQLYKRWERNEE